MAGAFGSAPMNDRELIERHVAEFNRGVRTGNWEPMLAELVNGRVTRLTVRFDER